MPFAAIRMDLEMIILSDSESDRERQISHDSISPPNEYSGLISFRIDWFDLLAVQETLKSLLQHHNSILEEIRPE